MEDTSLQLRDMKLSGEKSVAKIKQNQHFKKQRKYEKKKQAPEGKPCGYCGLTGVHREGQNCPAYGKKCRKCQKLNHFAVVCKAHTMSGNKDTEYRNRKNPSNQYGTNRWRDQQKQVKKTTTKEQGDSTSSDDDFFAQTVKHLKQVRRVTRNDYMGRTVTVRIDDVDTQVEPDSGAEVNVMDEHQFKALVHRSSKQPKLLISHTKLNTLQNKLPVKGEFKTVVRNETRGVATEFIVVKGRINSPPLSSAKTLSSN